MASRPPAEVSTGLTLEQVQGFVRHGLETNERRETSIQDLEKSLGNLDWENLSLKGVDPAKIETAGKEFIESVTGEILGETTRGRLEPLYEKAKYLFPPIEGDKQEKATVEAYRYLSLGLASLTGETDAKIVVRNTVNLAEAIKGLVRQVRVEEGIFPWLLWDHREDMIVTERTIVGAILQANQKPKEEEVVPVEEEQVRTAVAEAGEKAEEAPEAPEEPVAPVKEPEETVTDAEDKEETRRQKRVAVAHEALTRQLEEF